MENSGLGVDKDDLPHLFEHLFRVENSRHRETGSSGLGLSICKKLLRRIKVKLVRLSLF